MKSSVRSIVVGWPTIVDPVPPLSSIQDNSFPYFSRSSYSTFFFDGRDPRSTQYCVYFRSNRLRFQETNSYHRAQFFFLSFPSSLRKPTTNPSTTPSLKTIHQVSNRPTIIITNKLSEEEGERKDGYGVYFSGTSVTRRGRDDTSSCRPFLGGERGSSSTSLSLSLSLYKRVSQI